MADKLAPRVEPAVADPDVSDDLVPVDDDQLCKHVAGLAHVDLVAPFDAPTPLALIEALRPDVLVKGADYTEAQVVGAEVVRRYGGEVRLAPLVEGYSTTAAIGRMTARAP